MGSNGPRVRLRALCAVPHHVTHDMGDGTSSPRRREQLPVEQTGECVTLACADEHKLCRPASAVGASTRRFGASATSRTRAN